MQLGETGEQGLLLGAAGAQRRGGHGAGTAVERVEALSGEGGQDPAGADLQEGVGSRLGEGTDAVGEADGLADVPHPVLGIGELTGLGEGTGDVGDHRDARLGVGQRAGDLAEGVEHRLHQRRVEGVD